MYAFNPDVLYTSGLYTFIEGSIYKFSNVFAIRMAGMHMIVIGTIWIRTAVMPRWLALVTFILALVLLISITFLPWVTLVFPSWVIVISVYILILNYRYQQELSSRDGMTIRE